MRIEKKITELKNLSWIKHMISSDGYSYEKDIYLFTKPVEIELKSNDVYEYIRFSEPVIKISIITHLNDETYLIKFKLKNETIISFNCCYENYYNLIMVVDEGEEKRDEENETD